MTGSKAHRRRTLALRPWFGTLALSAGVLVTVSSPAPYFVRTEAPVGVPASGSEGATFRVRDVLVVLPPPSTRIRAYDDREWGVPWDGAPVLTLLNEGREPVVLRTSRARLVVGGSVFQDPNPLERTLGPGERCSVSLSLQRTNGAAVVPAGSFEETSAGTFCFGELVFPDGTAQPIEGELRGLVPPPSSTAHVPERRRIVLE